MTEKTEVPPETDPVFIEVDGPVASIVINRPDASNAINAEVREGLIRAVDAVAIEADVRCILLVGMGEEAFSVGADVAEYSTLLPEEAAQTAERLLVLFEKLSALDKPVIAVIRGACTGVGLELALHCDMRFAHLDARFGLPSVNVGLVASASTLDKLCRIIGEGQARALALTGGVISAERAFMVGLISNVVPEEEFDEALDQLVDHILTLPPVSVSETKKLLRLVRDKDLESAKIEGVEALKRCFSEGEARRRLAQLFGGPDPETTLH